MLATIQSAAVVGLSAVPVTVEVDVSDGLPNVSIVGLPDATVKESKDRIRSAIRNSRYAWPQTRVTVNLAPADTRKEGSAFDLPIALGLLAATQQLEPELLKDTIVLGELALDGSLRPVPGVLSVALKFGGKRMLLPAANAPEAAVVAGAAVYPLRHLEQAVAFLKGKERVEPVTGDPFRPSSGAENGGVDFAEIRGQWGARRAVEVAVAGGHNLLLLGPPGSGKTMLAQRIPTIMPELSLQEALETTAVYSVSGLLPPESPLITRRPFRAPHHTISDAGLVGGGSSPKPGEISFAHHGVLFLDELPEFGRAALEALRQPLEEGSVTISRAQRAEIFPAQFMLVASLNPCPCGYAGDSTRSCSCTPAQVLKYRARISGPLFDRIDLHVEVPALPVADLTSESQGEPSDEIRRRVREARERQAARFQGEPALFCNARMRHKQVKAFCRLDEEGRELMRRAIRAFGLSARAYDKVLKVARTIADLAGEEGIRPPHIAEAIQYRSLDRRP
jgi:magnesium chelatase family protein